MPPRKEPKETVVYAASKRKGPPFKPQRPTKVGRTSTTGSESSVQQKAAPRRLGTAPRRTIPQDDDEEQSEKQSDDEDDSDDLADNPLTARPRPSVKPRAAPPPRRPAPQPSPIDLSDEDDDVDAPLPSPKGDPPDDVPSLSEPDHPSIPQPLLVRLLHESFEDKSTKIDKHAIQVLQKYLEIFVKEAITRAALRKKEDVGVDDIDAGWLELEDLEKVAPGMVLDF